MGEPEEGADVALRVAEAQLELAGGDLVDAPGDVGVDEAEAQVAGGGQAGAPVAGIEPPVVHAAGQEGHHLVLDAEPPGDEVHAPARVASVNRASRASTARLTVPFVLRPAHVRRAP